MNNMNTVMLRIDCFKHYYNWPAYFNVVTYAYRGASGIKPQEYFLCGEAYCILKVMYKKKKRVKIHWTKEEN